MYDIASNNYLHKNFLSSSLFSLLLNETVKTCCNLKLLNKKKIWSVHDEEKIKNYNKCWCENCLMAIIDV